MRKLFMPILLFFGLNASATNVICTAPACNINSTSGLVPYDSIKMTTGIYTSVSFSNLPAHITIINYNGLVTVSAYIDFGNSTASMKDIHFTGTGYAGLTYGFKFTSNSDGLLYTSPNNQRLEFDHIDAENVPNNVFDCSGYSTNYASGDTTTFKWYKVSLHDLLMNNSGQLYQGTYGTIEQTPYISDSVTMYNIQCNNTSYKGSIVVGPISRLNAHDFTVIFIGLNSVTGDVGMFQVAGNGTINHIYQYGGRGYICRMLNFSLAAFPSAFTFYDNIKLATNAYGLIDWRQDTSFYGGSNPLYTTSNASIFNNDQGNATDINGYVCPIAIIGVTAGAHCYVRNNLGFNNQYGANTIINDNSGGSWTSIASDTSNNKYLSAAQSVVALADTNLYCNLVSSSPLAASGVATFVTQDFSYRTLANPPPTGAEAYASASTPPTLTAAGGATVDAAFNITYTDNSAWRAAATSVQVNGTSLPGAAYSFSAGILTLTPSASSLLQTPGSKTITVIATGYSNDVVSQAVGVGQVAQISYTTQPTNPPSNPGNFPGNIVAHLLDQYGNQTAGTNSVTASATGAAYTLTGTATQAATAGIVTFTGLGVSGGNTSPLATTMTLTITSVATKVSNSFTIPAVNPPGCNCLPRSDLLVTSGIQFINH